jgi:hypothetical protein
MGFLDPGSGSFLLNLYLFIACIVPVVLLAIIILAVVLIIKVYKAKTKRCPFCAGTIRVEAVVCQHCGRDLPLSNVTQL